MKCTKPLADIKERIKYFTSIPLSLFIGRARLCLLRTDADIGVYLVTNSKCSCSTFSLNTDASSAMLHVAIAQF
jgi:hypothetical protein